MQNNAPIYCVKVIKKCFYDLGIDLLKWPLYSPDFNQLNTSGGTLKGSSIRYGPTLRLLWGRKQYTRAKRGSLLIKG